MISSGLFASTFFAATVLLAAPFAQAEYNGEINFTPSEVERHIDNLPTLIETATKSMKEHTKIQHAWVDGCGIGIMYGYISPYSKLNDAQRAYYIEQNARCKNPPTVKQIEITSCVIYTNRHLSKGFEAIGQDQVFKRIDTFFKANGHDGLALAFALRKLGWKIVYWNTDTKKAAPFPESRKVTGHNLADHLHVQRIALTKKMYVGDPSHPVEIDAFMTDFSPNPGSPIEGRPDITALEKFKLVPYFIGIAHGGFHVWPGYYGVVNESHSPYDPIRRKNIEVTPFLPPWKGPTGGGTEDTNYHSGIIAIPPGPWVWF